MKLLTIFTLSLFLNIAWAKSTVSVRPIGASPKGQFVAIEEYGYINSSKVPFSKIKIMNVWKQRYVGPIIIVNGNIKQTSNLSKVRAQAIKKAYRSLKKYNISGQEANSFARPI